MNQNILEEIKKSQSENEIRETTYSIIKTSKEILDNLKRNFGENSEKYLQAKKEYDEINKIIIESLKNDRKIIKEELYLIELEFTNLLRSQHNNNNLSTFLDKFGQIARKLNLDSSDISFLGDKLKLTNQYQEDLIKKILGKDYEKGFNDKYLRGYNNKIGNYLIKIQDFENQISQNNIKDINSLALANYFSYLESKGQLNIDTLLKNFGADNIYNLKEIWLRGNKDKYSLKAKERLEKMKGGKDLIEIIKIFDSTDIFLKEAYKLAGDKNKTDLAIKLLDKNINSIKEQFKKDLYNKFKISTKLKDDEIYKIIDEMFEKLKKHKDLKSLYKIFDEYNKKYNLGLEISDEAKKILEIQKKDIKIEILRTIQRLKEAEEKKDDKKIKELKNLLNQQELTLREIQLAIEVNKKINKNTINKLISGKITIEKHIENIRKTDKNFDELFKKYLSKQNQNNKNSDKQNQNNKNSDKQNQNNKNSNKQKKQNQNNTIKQKTETKTISNYSEILYNNGEIITYTQISNGNYIIGDNLEISKKEFEIIKKSQKSYENLINFRNTLQELNLDGLLKYRESIFKIISNKYTIDFNKNDDYLNENELKIFLVAILKSIGIEKIDSSLNINFLKTKIKQINNIGIVGGKKDNTTKSNSKIEKMFIKKYDPKGNGVIIEEKFEKNINNLFGINT